MAKSIPKDFKISILQPNAKGMKPFCLWREDVKKTWNNLDIKTVNFKSDHRSRTRYMYWQFSLYSEYSSFANTSKKASNEHHELGVTEIGNLKDARGAT